MINQVKTILIGSEEKLEKFLNMVPDEVMIKFLVLETGADLNLETRSKYPMDMPFWFDPEMESQVVKLVSIGETLKAAKCMIDRSKYFDTNQVFDLSWSKSVIDYIRSK